MRRFRHSYICALIISALLILPLSPILKTHAESLDALHGYQYLSTTLKYSETHLPAAGGRVDIIIGMQNSNENVLDDVTVWKGDDLIHDQGTMQRGEFKAATVPLELVAGDLDNPIVINFSFLIGMQWYGVEQSFTVKALKQTQPGGPFNADDLIAIKRTASEKSVFAGEEVTLSYTVTNKSQIYTLNDVVLGDGGLGNIGAADSLAPGQSVSYSKSTRLVRPFVSAPRVDAYIKAGTLATTAESLTVDVRQPHIDVDIKLQDPNVSVGDTGLITGKITNNGNCELNDVKFTIDTLGVVAEIGVLNVGESLDVYRSFRVEEKPTLAMKVEGTTGGKPWPQDLGELEVHPKVEDDSYRVNIDAKPDRTRITGPGAVVLTVAVTNSGRMPLHDIEVVIDEAANVTRKIDALAPMERQEVTYTAELDATRDFRIFCTFPGAGGASANSETRALRVMVVPPRNEAANWLDYDIFVNLMQRINSFIGLLIVIIVGLFVLLLVFQGVYVGRTRRKGKKKGAPG